MAFDQSFLGTGWSFPPEFNRPKRGVVMTSNEIDIQKSLEILLSTKLGERIMLPSYGCNLDELLFKPLDLTLRTYISELIRKAILYHEPRIDVLKIDLSESDEFEGKVLIHINYIIRSTNSRKNMVFPFYKEEGTNL
ncbi:GPW/gp25 family protein [Echinicola sp. CAU 1574]|uniref:GPW/gp25 family protein n=1 Tax=Echinicola arenosa TaxID=2774144 RepID=A0ABR9AKD5_9BACT|nr:GPW/gp25 family protein [Echinicola arenosa]MBD8489282.1 GPW/gp25 family protein [Echinicola arenosa]